MCFLSRRTWECCFIAVIYCLITANQISSYWIARERPRWLILLESSGWYEQSGPRKIESAWPSDGGSCHRATAVSLQGHARWVRTRGCSLQVLSAHRGPDLVSQTGAHVPNKKRSSVQAFMSLSTNRSILQASHGMGSAGTRWNSPLVSTPWEVQDDAN